MGSVAMRGNIENNLKTYLPTAESAITILMQRNCLLRLFVSDHAVVHVVQPSNSFLSRPLSRVSARFVYKDSIIAF